MRGAVYSIKGNTVRALAGGPLSLADMGERTTERASRLEFHAESNKWQVLDPRSGAVLHEEADYDTALQWETDHFNDVLLRE